ncbi:isrso13-transposase protein [Stigmatella aurantiaca DW4/3-1]|uniref:Isrso13-transposase protein n=1 Tax=Stigmatella aurantiaca (strain DW4/3-1) TaxID=378806 RepID=Q09BD0_STIAD|nr:isrso13-transposase protein [Stigmatella aurantiaca DW4/3-1]
MMAFDAILERFVKNSPVSVMARLVLQRAVSAEWMDSLFEAHRKRQYTRELLFSTVVELMSVVAMGLRPSLHAGAKATEGGTSIAALYEKVNRMEPDLVRALVRGSAQRLEPVVQPLRTGEKPWAEGYRVRVMDGNHLPASEKRLKPLREFRGAALPGHSLVVYAPEQGLVVDVVPCEDAHAQERTLVAAVLEHAQQGDLWIADRNFSTTRIVFGLEDRHAAFIIREHGRTPSPTEVGKRKRVGRVETGVVFEQPVQVEDDGGRLLTLRRIELQLDEPTEEGEPLIRLLTNAPKEKLSAEEGSVFVPQTVVASKACFRAWSLRSIVRCGRWVIHERRCSHSGLPWWPTTSWRSSRRQSRQRTPRPRPRALNFPPSSLLPKCRPPMAGG